MVNPDRRCGRSGEHVREMETLLSRCPDCILHTYGSARRETRGGMWDVGCGMWDARRSLDPWSPPFSGVRITSKLLPESSLRSRLAHRPRPSGFRFPSRTAPPSPSLGSNRSNCPGFRTKTPSQAVYPATACRELALRHATLSDRQPTLMRFVVEFFSLLLKQIH
ncbi:hypothetical protein L209DRAFT_180913 [Thermothelomyces heterothallicus CBS 203.75]